VLMVEGLHVPVTGVELLEEVGREGAVVDWQSGPIGLNVVVMFGRTVTVAEATDTVFAKQFLESTSGIKLVYLA
jgi:hypothetical protein